MYYIAALTAAAYLILGLASRGEHVNDTGRSMMRPFLKGAGWLYKKACIHKAAGFHAGQIRKDLERLHPEERADVLETEYHVKKIGAILLIILLGTALGTVVKLQAEFGKELDAQGTILRGHAGEPVRELVLEAAVEKGFKKEFLISVLPRQMNREEAEEMEGAFWNRLCAAVIGQNQSFDEVCSDMNLVEEVEKFPFFVSWHSSDPGLIGADGTVYQTIDTGWQEVILTAEVEYCEWVWNHELKVRVVPPVRTEEERISREVERMLQQSQETDPVSQSWNLPLEVEGKQITWMKKAEDNSLLFWGMVMAAAVCIYFLMDKDLHDRRVRQGQLMSAEYPQILNKMVLYLGAGLTVRGSFQKIAGDYKKAFQQGGQKLPAYEEMVYTCHELQTGISEGAAYERFGRRTGLQEYVRFSTLLNQNLKKGSSMLVQRLREEAEKAAQEEKNRQKKTGEEASTRLLVPLVIMLAVIMALVMFPAFSSMGV